MTINVYPSITRLGVCSHSSWQKKLLILGHPNGKVKSVKLRTSTSSRWQSTTSKLSKLRATMISKVNLEWLARSGKINWSGKDINRCKVQGLTWVLLILKSKRMELSLPEGQMKLAIFQLTGNYLKIEIRLNGPKNTYLMGIRSTIKVRLIKTRHKLKVFGVSNKMSVRTISFYRSVK